MKRNVSVKVFATKAGDLTERTEKPVFGASVTRSMKKTSTS